MTANRPTLLFLGVAFLGGAVGGFLSQSSRSTPARAENLTPTEVRQLSQELGERSGPLWDASENLSKIARLASPSVVHIEARYKGPKGSVEETGSGVIIRSQKRTGLFVVTNRHVIHEASLSNIKITLADNRELNPIQVWTDGATDLAVLRLGIDDAPIATFGDSSRTEIGHMVLAMGSPFGLSQSVTLGIISAKGRRSLALGEDSEVINQNFLQTDAAINPGNSGGPLINLHGRVVGINTAIASNSGGSEGIGFAIPSNLVRHVVDQLLVHGRVKRGFLGVHLDPRFDLSAANRLGLDRVQGARVVSVLKDTPAMRARLEPNDVILNFDGRPIEDERDLINQVSLMPVGTRIEMIVLRKRRKIRLFVVLTDRPTEVTRKPESETRSS